MVTSEIVLVDDDEDDKDLLEEVLGESGRDYSLRWFQRSEEAYEYLRTTERQPFIIICDINLPGTDGLQFKSEIDRNPGLRKKSIPFVFLTTAINKSIVERVYDEIAVQGYFEKPRNFQALRDMVVNIISYWEHCRHPNSG